ncbi:MAG TPA: hypothetical protein VMZ06_18655 [Candidatus Bathyarchaeia archaeon]|nr:hypothetical protein [Candidatus Bathyarchaeia archaeon]
MKFFQFVTVAVWGCAVTATAVADTGLMFGSPAVALGADTEAVAFETEGSFALVGGAGGGQVAFARPLKTLAMALEAGEEARAVVPVEGLAGAYTVTGEASLIAGGEAEVWLELGPGAVSRARLASGSARLTVAGEGTGGAAMMAVGAVCTSGEAVVRWRNVEIVQGIQATAVDFFPAPQPRPPFPTLRDVAMRPILEREITEWDWRLQDGIGVGSGEASYEAAIEKTLGCGDALRAWIEREGIEPAADAPERSSAEWDGLRTELTALRVERAVADDARWEDLWRRAHAARRRLTLGNPLARTGPVVFAKYVPGAFSHQLTQYYGRYARPGGGLFVLERPGESMAVRQLAAGVLPQGSYMQPEVTCDGQSVLAAFCAVDTPPQDTRNGDPGRYFHLYEFAADGSGVQAGRPHHKGPRQLTDGPYDDFAPRELSDGEVVFVSTRRGGWHRCGGIGCPVYTLTRMARDGTGIRTISYHETQEWDPAVLNDGRLIYTRWDYVDRNAVHYQQLWTTRPDGSSPVVYYGNNTLSPAGIWEARPVPGSQCVMATAGAHHAMSAGSIVLVDVRHGVDGPDALTRLTPDAPFPETEAPLLPGWRAPYAVEPPSRPPEMDRWPGQCYKSPWPISEEFFLAAYSYDALIGEPTGNQANMFGLYLVDAFGNKELLYRDLNISSAWPVPLRPRKKAPAVAPAGAAGAPKEGTYFLQDVYESEPAIEKGSVKRLRIVQVLPKGTPIANTPRVGVANASPGKQVLGTVPVEADGSAYFNAPAGIPLAFQALDEKGQAVQIMRSLSYLQPAEVASCTGCHEPRLSAPPPRSERPLALRRAASAIEPGPDGSSPLSYPILVQPVLDKLCVRCHGGEKPAGPEGKPIVLTGAIEGEFTTSYNALAERVAYSAWGKGKFPEGNGEPMTQPGAFGAKGSPLMKMLLAGHNKVELSPDDLDRLTTWMDANGLFYGTFDFEAQKRQQLGARIDGPSVE